MLEQPWVEELFLKVLNMSLTASCVIVAILLVRFALKRVPKVFSYVLWSVALFRLLCPFSFSADFSFLRVMPENFVGQGQMEYISEEMLYPEKQQSELPVAVDNNIVPSTNGEMIILPEEQTVTDWSETMVTFASWIWLAGIGVLIFYSAVTLVNLRRKLCTAREDEQGAYITERIDTPFVYGVFRPRIYLPSALNSKEKEYILMHERIHIKRGDHIVKIVAFFAVCLHWFNPLVWVAFFLSGKDMEMSCDEAVIRKIGDCVKKDYSTSLLVLSSGKRIVNGVPLAFGEGETGSRIRNILKYKKPTMVVSVVVIAVCIIAAVFLLANPKKEVTEEKHGNISGEEAQQVTTAVYGVIMDVSIDDTEISNTRIVRIPGWGDLDVPAANEVSALFETTNYELMPGDIVKITFEQAALYDEEGNYIGVEILESYPGRFVNPVESIVCLGRQAYLESTDDGLFRQVIPRSFILGAVAGDTVEIYHQTAGESGQEEDLLVAGVLKEADGYTLGALSLEMTQEQVWTYLSEFGFGITHKVFSQETGEEVEKGWEEPDYRQ